MTFPAVSSWVQSRGGGLTTVISFSCALEGRKNPEEVLTLEVSQPSLRPHLVGGRSAAGRLQGPRIWPGHPTLYRAAPVRLGFAAGGLAVVVDRTFSRR